MTDPKDLIRNRIKREVVSRRLTYAQVAARVGVVPRTVQRFLEGDTFSPRTANEIAHALRIELTDPTEERLLRGLNLWRLHGSATWWARLADVAEHAGSSRHGLVQRVQRAEHRGELSSEEVRRGVRDRDVAVMPRDSSLTDAPQGCTMLSARACLWVLLTADTDPGAAALATLIDEGLERLRSAGVRR